jgi:hypothetical protein
MIVKVFRAGEADPFYVGMSGWTQAPQPGDNVELPTDDGFMVSGQVSMPAQWRLMDDGLGTLIPCAEIVIM